MAAMLVLIAYLPPPRFPSISRLVYPVKPSTSLLRYPRLVSVVPISPIQRLKRECRSQKTSPLLSRWLPCSGSVNGSAPNYLRRLLQPWDSRPRAADATIPVTLLHPIFRQFIDNCKNHQPIQEDNKLVLELMGAMSDFFPDENVRAAKLRAILTKHGIPVDTSTITSKGHHFPTDGAVSINGHLVAITEVIKGEVGSKGAEPYAQVILYYSHSNAAKSQEFSQFNFPSLLITAFGQTLLSSLATCIITC